MKLIKYILSFFKKEKKEKDEYLEYLKKIIPIEIDELIKKKRK